MLKFTSIFFQDIGLYPKVTLLSISEIELGNFMYYKALLNILLHAAKS